MAASDGVCVDSLSNPSTMTENIISLLQKINEAGVVETFINFPEVNRSGPYKIEKEEVAWLREEGFIEQSRKDVFGEVLQLTEKARQMLRNQE